MGNVRTLLVLIASVFFLSHCSGEDAKPPLVVGTMDLGGNECIAGVYKGEGDIRKDRWYWFDPNQDLTVSIAFKGDSALVKVEGEDDDLLCTRYEGLTITKDENKDENEEGVVSFLNGSRVTNNRKKDSSLVDGLLEIQVDLTDEDNPCSFNIPAYDANAIFGSKTDDDAVGSQLVRQEEEGQTADFDTLLEECGGEDSFSPQLSPGGDKPVPISSPFY